MKLIKNWFELLKVNNSSCDTHKACHIPKYLTCMDWEQDSDQSITSDGIYDLENFSKHESDTIKHICSYVDNHYPKQYLAMGLANEGCALKYKPRYIINEIVVQKYQHSESQYDKFAVANAYVTKGTYFTEKALWYFENCINYITPEIMEDFISFSPLRTYGVIAQLYEHEHEYEKAIYYIRLQKNYGSENNAYFNSKIKDLENKNRNFVPKRNIKISKRGMEFEEKLEKATKLFLSTGEFPKK